VTRPIRVKLKPRFINEIAPATSKRNPAQWITGATLGLAMRIRFWLSTLCLATYLSASGQSTIRLPSGKEIAYSGSGSDTVFTLPNAHGRDFRLRVDRDATVANGQRPTSVKVVAEIPDSILVLSDAYPSIPGGMAYCQAGEEQFLRVISTSRKRPIETYHLKLASCRDNIELATPGLTWSPQTHTLAGC